MAKPVWTLPLKSPSQANQESEWQKWRSTTTTEKMKTQKALNASIHLSRWLKQMIHWRLFSHRHTTLEFYWIMCSGWNSLDFFCVWKIIAHFKIAIIQIVQYFGNQHTCCSRNTLWTPIISYSVFFLFSPVFWQLVSQLVLLYEYCLLTPVMKNGHKTSQWRVHYQVSNESKEFNASPCKPWSKNCLAIFQIFLM